MKDFQRELAQSCFEAYVEVDGIGKIFDSFRARHMSQLSQSELEIFDGIIEKFDGIQADFHRLYVFAKYTEAV